MNLEYLIRPSEFQRRNPSLFHTLAALRGHLNRRRENGLMETGAVVESPLGLLIDEPKFADWLRRGAAEERAA